MKQTHYIRPFPGQDARRAAFPLKFLENLPIMSQRPEADGLTTPLEKLAQVTHSFITCLKTTPYLSFNKVVALASLFAVPLRAQSVAGGYSDAVGFGAMGGAAFTLELPLRPPEAAS